MSTWGIICGGCSGTLGFWGTARTTRALPALLLTILEVQILVIIDDTYLRYRVSPVKQRPILVRCSIELEELQVWLPFGVLFVFCSCWSGVLRNRAKVYRVRSKSTLFRLFSALKAIGLAYMRQIEGAGWREAISFGPPTLAKEGCWSYGSQFCGNSSFHCLGSFGETSKGSHCIWAA